MAITGRVSSPQDFLGWLNTFDEGELAQHGWTLSALLKVSQDYSYWINYSGHQIAAALFYHQLGPHHFEVLFLGTSPQERRKGCLSQLFLHFFSAHPELRLWLECREDNPSARALYRKLGFEELGRRSHYYNDGSDAILMEFFQKPGL